MLNLITSNIYFPIATISLNVSERCTTKPRKGPQIRSVPRSYTSSGIRSILSNNRQRGSSSTMWFYQDDKWSSGWTPATTHHQLQPQGVVLEVPCLLDIQTQQLQKISEVCGLHKTVDLTLKDVVTG